MNYNRSYSYYYGTEAEQFYFYRIPKALFTDEQFSGLSCEAKVLYGLLLDRMGLSIKNKWTDNENRVFVYFKLQEVMQYIGCSHEKAGKLLAELDSVKGIGLIERKKQGMGRPDRIYVKNFIKTENPAGEKSDEGTGETAEPETSENQNATEQKTFGEFRKTESQYTEMQMYKEPKTGSYNFGFSDANDIEIKDIEFSKINSSIHQGSSASKNRKEDRWKEIEAYRMLIYENIGYDVLCLNYASDSVKEIAELILEVICSSRDEIKIAGEERPIELVKGRFLKLNQMHIAYVLDCLADNENKVRNIKGYLLTSLYNAPSTMSHYYRAKVNFDFIEKNNFKNPDGSKA